MNIYRPLLIATFAYCFGILTMYFYKDYILFVLLICLLVGLLTYCLYRKHLFKGFLVFFLVFILGLFMFYRTDLTYNNTTLIKEKEITGEVVNILKIKDNNLKVFKLKTEDNINIICYYRDEKNKIKSGNIYKIIGETQLPQKQRNPGGFNEENYYRTNNWSFKIYADEVLLVEDRFNIRKILFLFKSKLEDSIDRILPKEQSATIKSMLLGGNYEDNEEIKELFKRAGIIHILAISGLHVTTIGWLLFNMLNKTILPKKASYIITVIILFLYSMMTGFSTATTRAFLMFTIIFAGGFFGRKSDIYNSISLAGLIILLINPFMLFHMGFQLSFSAVIAIVTLTPLLEKVLPSSIISKYVSASVAAFLGTWPIITYYYYYISTYSIIINILVVPMVTVLLLVGFSGGIIGIFSTLFGKLIMGGVYFLLRLYEVLAEFFTSLPLSTIITGKPHIVFIITYYLIIGVTIYVIKNELYWDKKIILSIFIVFGSLMILSTNRHNTVTYLDVGQGDCAVINTANNTTYIIDGGGGGRYSIGENVLYPYLMYLGVNSIDGIFLSHSDKDHISGLIEIIEMVEVKTIYITNQSIQQNDYLINLLDKAKEYNIEVKNLSNGHVLQGEQLVIKCLEPRKRTWYPSNNDSSMVLGINLEEFNFLFTGDIEEFGEHMLISNKLSHYDVMKIPHHGSNTSTSQLLLEKVSPKIAIISCGVNNKYGHPHIEVINRLKKRNINIYNTANDGAILITVKNKEMNIRRWLRE